MHKLCSLLNLKKLFNDMPSFFLPSWYIYRLPLDKHCHIPVPSQWQQYCDNVEGIILHGVFLVCLVFSKIGPLPCLGEWEEREAFIIIDIKLTLGNSRWFSILWAAGHLLEPIAAELGWVVIYCRKRGEFTRVFMTCWILHLHNCPRANTLTPWDLLIRSTSC